MSSRRGRRWGTDLDHILETGRAPDVTQLKKDAMGRQYFESSDAARRLDQAFGVLAQSGTIVEKRKGKPIVDDPVKLAKGKPRLHFLDDEKKGRSRLFFSGEVGAAEQEVLMAPSPPTWFQRMRGIGSMAFGNGDGTLPMISEEAVDDEWMSLLLMADSGAYGDPRTSDAVALTSE